MTYFYMKAVSGLFTKCSKCDTSIKGGENVMIPIDFTDSQTWIIYPPICMSCYRKDVGYSEEEKAMIKLNSIMDSFMGWFDSQ